VGADCDADAEADVEAGVVGVLELLEPARLHPVAMSVTAATAVSARMVGLTGFLPFPVGTNQPAFLLAQTSRLGRVPRRVLTACGDCFGRK
jgi:hypothetical protein